jgi:CubicO group peptidase (beta-lactamase class C family)
LTPVETSGRDADLDAVLATFRDRGLFSHAYAAYGSLDEPLPIFEAATPDAQNAAYDLSSLTKALVTAPLACGALTGDFVDLRASFGSWVGMRRLPKGVDVHPRLLGLKLGDLLGHRSGLPAWRNFWTNVLAPDMPVMSMDDQHRHIVTRLNHATEALDPARGGCYSDLGFLLLGFGLERRFGVDLSVQWREFMHGHLKLPVDLPLQFAPVWEGERRFVPTSFCPSRERQLEGEVHDENGAALGGITGHTGLFGTGRALGQYLVALARHSFGKEFILANSACRRTAPFDRTDDGLLGMRQGVGLSSEVYAGGRAIGHLGFTGTAFWISPERRDYAILLTNRVCSGRLNPLITDCRRQVFQRLDALAG